MNKNLFGDLRAVGDFKDIKGQYHIKRGLEVAVVGGHNVLLIGSHKSGKTFIKDRVNTITDIPISIYEYLPCPCGNFTDPKNECFCSPTQVRKHISQIPKEILDSCDIHIEVARIPYDLLLTKREGEPSAIIKERVLKAKQNKKPTENNMKKEAQELLKMAIIEIGISAKNYDKIVNIAGTIAQIDNSPTIEAHHISEAIGYRSLDRNLWL
jgi:predicted ATPase with chaperone activity